MSQLKGIEPWLPWPLRLFSWWTEPIPAERLAALRIGTGLLVMVDALWTYLPRAGEFFPGSGWPVPWGEPPSFWRFFLSGGQGAWQFLLAAWALCGLCLMLGLATRVSAVLAWLLALNVHGANPWLINSGDHVLTIILFVLMLSPANAAWSLDRWLRGERGPAVIPPWPIRLLFIQLCLIYFCNGLAKLGSEPWREGRAAFLIMTGDQWTRFAWAQVPLAGGLAHFATWPILFWELTFPLLMAFRASRLLAIGFGIFFHVATAIFLTLAIFPFAMLCLYLPLAPWERLARRPECSEQGAGAG